ncbi:hypothetical protein A2V82_12770 [candidate division KSB1 bacterium RBG_16_48_16]|nr:MAG: hypothetical protein A2V82_12770 [candidate division KSB1 bacterium RBG_16_48_16]
MNKNIFIHFVLFIFLILSSLTVAGDRNDNNPLAPSDSRYDTEVVKGFGISPQGFPLDYSKLADFYTEIGGMVNGGVMWNGSWRDDVFEGTDAGAIPAAAAAIIQSSNTFNFTPIEVFGWRSGATLFLNVPGNQTNDWTNTEAKNLFLSMLVDFATIYKPPFVFLGNENDFYYEQNPADYANWISYYNSAYDAIKATSSATLVGPVFNFEHMAGAGVLNGWTTPYWGALDAHDLGKIDIVGVTVYPWFNYASARSVPSNYLDPLASRINSKPIAITETGWPAENLAGLNPTWETSEAAQVAYLLQLSAMPEGKNIRMVNWLFLYQMADPGGSPLEWKLFGSVSIRDGSGKKRTVYDLWLSYHPTLVEDTSPEMPKVFNLLQNYPNPFNSETLIAYQLPRASEVEISVFNLQGQKVATLARGHQIAGEYKLLWDASGLPSGLYLYRIQMGDFIQTKKAVLLK